MDSQSNLFILGRSGTGKTTTTVLRFFCQETLYRVLRKQQRLLNDYWIRGAMDEYKACQKQLPRLMPEDMGEDTAVRMVFVTASPVLTNEVKQYYGNLKQQLETHLLRLERSKDAIANGDEVDEESKVAQAVAEAGTEDEAQAERRKLITLLELKQQEAEQEHAAEQQWKLPDSFSMLQSHHFPLFLTVQRLVYMLDASLERSFFSRTADGKIIGMDSSLGWHSENQGVFMIN